MAAVEFDPEQFPKRINLGCGWDVRPGYLNVDLHGSHNPDLVADVCDLHMLPDAFYDEVVAQDVLEHLQREQALPALREWARITRPGGTLVLRVPNLIGLVELMAHHLDVETQRELVQCLYGTQAYNGDYHQNGFTELLLRHDLYETGFGDPVFTSKDHWLFDVTALRTDTPAPPSLADCTFMTFGATGIPVPGSEAQESSLVASAAIRAGRVARRAAGRVRRRLRG